VFLACNLFEWWVHRYVMHRPVKGFMGIYRRHTLAHHEFFTHLEPTINNTRDFRITFFPPYAMVTFIAISIPPPLVVGWLWSANAGWLLMCTTVGMYLNYELFHWCCHVKNDRFVGYAPFVNSLRRHHIAHQNQAIMMGMNFAGRRPEPAGHRCRDRHWRRARHLGAAGRFMSFQDKP
jgi:hypothetical protein